MFNIRLAVPSLNPATGTNIFKIKILYLRRLDVHFKISVSSLYLLQKLQWSSVDQNVAKKLHIFETGPVLHRNRTQGSHQI